MPARAVWIVLGIVAILACGLFLLRANRTAAPPAAPAPFNEAAFLSELGKLHQNDTARACDSLLNDLGRTDAVDKEHSSAIVSEYTHFFQSNQPLRAGRLAAFVLSKKPAELFAERLVDHACKKLGGSRNDEKFRPLQGDDLHYFEDLLFVVAKSSNAKGDVLAMDYVGIAVETKQQSFTSSVKYTISIGIVPKRLLNSRALTPTTDSKSVTLTSDELIQFLKDFSEQQEDSSKGKEVP